jgi:Sigma-70 region 2
MQDAYVRAYQHLDQFDGGAPFSAWLTRIAVHEALRLGQSGIAPCPDVHVAACRGLCVSR